MTQPLPSLEDFIHWCGKLEPILQDLKALSSPTFFCRSIYGAAVSADKVLTKIDSLKCAAKTLEKNRDIANYFATVDPKNVTNLTSDDDDDAVYYHPSPGLISNPEEAYRHIYISLQGCKAKNRKSVSCQSYKHYLLMHIGQEFECLKAETENLRNLFTAGSDVLSDPTSLKHHKEFDDSLRCVMDLHRSECGVIRKPGIRRGTPFADMKLEAYVATCRKWAPHLISDSVSAKADASHLLPTSPALEKSRPGQAPGPIQGGNTCDALNWVGIVNVQFSSNSTIKYLATSITNECPNPIPEALYQYKIDKLPNPCAKQTCESLKVIVALLTSMLKIVRGETQ